jgi:mRNA interferase MazF
MGRSYVPDRGDAIWLEFDPQAGHEQAGRRPAVVLSPAGYNSRSSLAIVCPVTRQSKGYPFEVVLPEGLPVTGVALADHARSLDWKARKAERICRLPDEVVHDIAAKLVALVMADEGP